MDLPSDKATQRAGRLAASHVSTWLQQNDIVVRQEEQSTDFGVDLELELHEGRYVSGLLVKCQVKGTQGPAFAKSNVESVSIKTSTQNYWATLPLNVMCILCDLSDGAIYWQPASATLANTTHTSLQFSQAMRADQNPDAFHNALVRMAETPTSSKVLSLVPACMRLFTELSLGFNAVYDRGFETKADVDGSIRVFYEHLERLCMYTGADELPARWLVWERRNSIIQTALDSADSGLLDGNVAGEIIRYSAAFYKSALSRVKDCVDPWSIVESNPGLAGMLLSNTFDSEVIGEAFERLDAGEHFYLVSDTHYSFGMNQTPQDSDFDGELQRLQVAYYRLPAVQ
ncbi:DUF4365 domain-containing protein [Kocuria sp. JC486]|uniref:DUF4365 domain-containing protein n=1 Tax=Kocuria sp. JC486 TaxID=1970736 RepID=UPI00141DC3FD|nr:DUF4365 domain-containing protein [Kocuria sp. JC486]NHU85899.1 DUF4365 domain-containing protein [Kocuria sp. JC486]